MSAYLYFLCSLLITLTISDSLIRLSSKKINQLRASDYLYSTLGEFRVRLIEKTCQLKIEEFNNYNYNQVGEFPDQPRQYPCTHLQLAPGLLITPYQQKFLEIDSAIKEQPRQTILNIDDLGIIRLIALRSIQESYPSEEVWISIFRSPKQYIYSRSTIQVSSEDTLSYRKNQGGWGFSARAGKLRIFMVNDPKKIVEYKYNQFDIKLGQVMDKDHHQPPSANILGLKYQQRCGFIHFLDFKPPFVFEINKYWPELRVLDQGGYQIVSIRYPSFNCLEDLGITQREGQLECYNWFCPDNTLMYEGKCVVECPLPYYYQIKANGRNRCVKRCQQGAFINQSTRICTCSPQNQQQLCSQIQNTTSYPLGCLCQKQGKQKLFFNGAGCSISCTIGQTSIYFQDFSKKGGICIQCPYKCRQCTPSEGRMRYINFLTCIECEEGYQTIEGLCKKKCIPQVFSTQLKIYNNQDCPACNTEFCYRCKPTSVDICEACIRPYTLFKSACIKKCPLDHIMKPNKQMRFECQPIRKCQTIDTPIFECYHCAYNDFMCSKNCNNGQFFKNQASCYCKYAENSADQNGAYSPGCLEKPPLQKSIIMYKGKAINLMSLACPIKYFLYMETQECLRCPFGCLTCLHDEGGIIDCTSCAPSYFLAVDVDWGNYCQRDSSLLSCQDQQTKFRPATRYNPLTKICDFGENRDRYAERATRTLCYQSQPFCLTCLEKSDSICTLCAEGYFLLGGKCLNSCPKKLIYQNKTILIVQHQRTCIMVQINGSDNAAPEFTHCKFAKVSINSFIFDIEKQFLSLEGYKYFLPSNYIGTNQVLDPSGRVFFFASLSNRTIQSKREGYFDEGSLICEQCEDYYGKHPGTGQCQPCLQKACLVCPNSQINTCWLCHNDFILDANGMCMEKNPEQKDCKIGEFRWSDMVCRDNCAGYYYPLIETEEQKVINCTNYCWNQISDQVPLEVLPLLKLSEQRQYPLICKVEKNIDDNQTLDIAGTYYQVNKNTWIFFLSPIQMEFKPSNFTNNSVNVNLQIAQERRLMLEAQQSVQTYVQQDRVISIVQTDRQFQFASFLFAVNQIYGENQNGKKIFLPQRQYRMNIQFTQTYEEGLRRGLAVYGCIFVIIVFLIAIQYIGMSILYKVDNFVILMQMLTLSLFSMELRFTQRDFYRFLYGFRWTVGHWDINHFQNSILFVNNPTYLQYSPHNAPYLLTVDNNLLRNCFPMFFLMVLAALLFTIGYIVLKRQIPCLIHNHFQNKKKQQIDNLPIKTTYLPAQTDQKINQIKSDRKIVEEQQLKIVGNQDHRVGEGEKNNKVYDQMDENSQKHGIYSEIDIDHSHKLELFLIFIIETFSLPLVYYSISTLTAKNWELSNGSHYLASIIISIFVILGITIYSVGRFRVSRVGGYYMFKRIGFGILIAQTKGNTQIICYTAIIQLIFFIIRLYYQQIIFSIPDKKSLLILTLQQTLTIITLILLGLTDKLGNNKVWATVLVAWLLCNLYMMSFLFDIIDMVLTRFKKKRDHLPMQSGLDVIKIRRQWEYSTSILENQ